MNNKIGEMEMYVLVVERASFAAAARALRLTPSAVSRGIASLEARIGVRLLQRTTRSLAMTAEGEAFYARAAQLLSEVHEIETCFSNQTNEPRGKLRINSNVPYGIHKLIPLLPKFAAQHPKVIIDLTLSDALVDLNEERVDIAIRLGPAPAAKLRVRKLGTTPMIVVASPSYLAKQGTPKVPNDLRHHRCITFNFRRAMDSRPFQLAGKTVNQVVPSMLMADSGESLRQLVMSGAGIARLGKFQVIEDLSKGSLVPLLESCNPGDELQAMALYSARLHIPSRVHAFVDFLASNGTLAGD
jgi:DNA-binding transcriptional LysR family regulator